MSLGMRGHDLSAHAVSHVDTVLRSRRRSRLAQSRLLQNVHRGAPVGESGLKQV